MFTLITGCSSYSGTTAGFSHRTYTAPNNAFSVEVPFRSPDIKDALEGDKNVQYVDFYYDKYYPELGVQTIEWLNNEQIQRLNLQDKEKMKKVFKNKEKSSGLIPVDNNFHCESENINGYNAFECNELVKFIDPKRNYLKPSYYSMTVIYFKQSMAVAYGYGSLEVHHKFVNSIRPLS